jgi:hypothetical protein
MKSVIHMVARCPATLLGPPFKFASYWMGLLTLGIIVGGAQAASSSDIDKLTTYATLIGRGIACGVDTDEATRKVGAWMDRRFTKKEMSTYLLVFAQGMEYHAKQQRDGRSPDSCSDIRRNFDSIPFGR